MKNHSDLQELQDFLRAALRDPVPQQQLPSAVATKP
jgi:D-alanine--poly(phosphoribitol) ligase subunit 1